MFSLLNEHLQTVLGLIVLSILLLISHVNNEVYIQPAITSKLFVVGLVSVIELRPAWLVILISSCLLLKLRYMLLQFVSVNDFISLFFLVVTVFCSYIDVKPFRDKENAKIFLSIWSI